MHASPTLELFLLIFKKPNLFIHIDPVHRRSSQKEWKIKRVTIISGHHSRFRLPHMLKESSNRRRLPRSVPGRGGEGGMYLVCLVEDDKRTLIIGRRSVLKVLNIGTDDFPIRN